MAELLKVTLEEAQWQPKASPLELWLIKDTWVRDGALWSSTCQHIQIFFFKSPFYNVLLRSVRRWNVCGSYLASTYLFIRLEQGYWQKESTHLFLLPASMAMFLIGHIILLSIWNFVLLDTLTGHFTVYVEGTTVHVSLLIPFLSWDSHNEWLLSRMLQTTLDWE